MVNYEMKAPLSMIIFFIECVQKFLISLQVESKKREIALSQIDLILS